MNMTNEDRQLYVAWKHSMLKQLPQKMKCEDCGGTGDGECPHCGHDADCEECGGSGKVFTSTLLTEEFYMRVMAFEKAAYDRWLAGQPLLVVKGRNQPVNPLNLLLVEIADEKQPGVDAQEVFGARIVLSIHGTSTS